MIFGYTFVIAMTGALVALLTAVANKSLAQIAWHELEDYCRRKQNERVFDDIHDRYDTAIASTEILQTGAIITAILAIHSSQSDLGSERDGWQLSLGMIITLLAALTLTVWVPREVARCWGTAYLTNTWTVWQSLDRLLRPVHFVASSVRFVTRRLSGHISESSDEEALEDEILSIVTEGQHDGLLEDDVREMIAGVIELDNTEVADIMTPRSQMDVVSLDTPWPTILKFVVRVGRTRIPVYNKNLDDVVGLLYVKDLLAFLLDENDDRPRSLSEILREVQRVPKSKRLDELLQSFLHTRSHLAIVVDEFMHVVGLVTIEDILEEIVGEIVDESDAEEPEYFRWVNEHSAEVQARAHVEEVNSQMGIQLPTSHEYDTVGGFILHEFGRIPNNGEILHWNTLQINIEHATKRRIERVRMILNQKPKTIGVT